MPDNSGQMLGNMDALKDWLTTGLAACSIVVSPVANSGTVPSELSAGTRVLLTLDEGVTSKRGESDVGQLVACRVWRNVEAGGVVFIKAGTPASCRVTKIKRRNIGGTEGKISIAGLETKSADGQAIMLAGGYNKEGSENKAVIWTVGLLLLWPMLLVPGGSAELPPGTIFDTTTASMLRMAVDTSSVPSATVDLSEILGAYSAEFMLDEFISSKKPETFKIKIVKSGAWPGQFVIDNVNEKSIEPIPLAVTDRSTADETTTAVCVVGIKVLSKHLQRGINRFQVAYNDGEQRIATEVLIDVQM